MRTVRMLAEGLRWLFDTEQPGGAVLSSHVSLTGPQHNRWYRLVPCGWEGHAVITVDVARVEWTGPGCHGVPANPLRPGELEELAADVTSLGAEVAHIWNGHPATTGSLALAQPAHPTLLAAVNRYRAGCPTHHTVFCGRPGAATRCDWYGLGLGQIVQPRTAIPTVNGSPPDGPGSRGLRGGAR